MKEKELKSDQPYEPVIVVKDAKKKTRHWMLFSGLLILSTFAVGGYCLYKYIDFTHHGGARFIAPRTMALQELDDRVARALDSFTCALHTELADGKENVFYSPFSVAVALSMTHAGCRGNTKKQLAELLRTSGVDDGVLASSYKFLFNKFGKDGSLHSANMMYTDQKFAVNPEYQTHLQGEYHATAESVDFVNEAEAARKLINTRVQNETRDKIVDLLPPGVLNEATRLVLVNAVYFKGMWSDPFRVSNTTEMDFTNINGEKVKVPMMSAKRDVMTGTHDDIKARSISLDYSNGFSMLVVLPNKDSNIETLEKALAKKTISGIINDSFKTELSIKIPKFKLEYEKSLKGIVAKMGASDLMTAGVADMSGIGGEQGDLYVSDVLHKAVVDVNEEGSEAAAATGVVIMTRMMAVMNRDPPFIADRPFLFFVYDQHTLVPMFAGRYVKPSQ